MIHLSDFLRVSKIIVKYEIMTKKLQKNNRNVRSEQIFENKETNLDPQFDANITLLCAKSV